ncbi:MAG: heavy-metal-associated domain-containing protein [Desulfobacteraceae bacterium]|nr:heavy-metal-associated domain-containing protein [Desulfobacteraceae bacterium]
MKQTIFQIPKISCGHCTKTIETALRQVEGVRSVTGNITEKTVLVQWEPPATLDTIFEILKQINYPALEQ